LKTSVKIKRLVIWTYSAFGNKEKLFRRALDRCVQQLTNFWNEAREIIESSGRTGVIGFSGLRMTSITVIASDRQGCVTNSAYYSAHFLNGPKRSQMKSWARWRLLGAIAMLDPRTRGEAAEALRLSERTLAENAEEIRNLGKRAAGDVIEIGRRLTEMKELCGRGNWLPWLQREFGWTDRHALFLGVVERRLHHCAALTLEPLKHLISGDFAHQHEYRQFLRRNRALSLGSARPALISLLSLSMISLGVLRGAPTPPPYLI
jgi:AcrR family transcriptional regulator